MKLYRRVVPFLLVFLLFASATAWSANLIQDGIGDSIAQPDGTQVTMTGEQVLWRGASDKSFAIKEWMEPRTEKPRLVVVSHSQLSVREGWSVDVTGVLGTYTDRDGGIQRVLVVSPADVLVYCSPNGKPCSFIPVKQSGIEWENKTSLVETAAAGYAGRSQSTFQDGGLPPLPDPPDPPIRPAVTETMPVVTGSCLQDLPNGAYVELQYAICHLESYVTHPYSSGYDYFWVSMSDRSSGIKVRGYLYAWEGDCISIGGFLNTDEAGERVLDLTSGGTWGHGYPLSRPIYLPQRSLVTGSAPKGQLIRVSGKVVKDLTVMDPDASFFYIDDGSGLPTDDPNVLGVKVYDPYYTYNTPAVPGEGPCVYRPLPTERWFPDRVVQHLQQRRIDNRTRFVVSACVRVLRLRKR